MKRAIITGGNGFVGQWLVKELLSQGYEVCSVVRNSRKLISHEHYQEVLCDMSDISELSKRIEIRGFDAFFHLAWEGSTGACRMDYEMQLRNAGYSCDALKAAKELECQRFLAAGTITEQVVQNAIKTGAAAPNMIYAISKEALQKILQVLARQLGIEMVWMQFSNVFGPKNTGGNLISYTLKTIQQGERPEFSSAQQPYDFIYVKDLVKAVILLAEKHLSRNSYFLGSGKPRILREYLEAIPEAIGVDVCMGIGARPDDGLRYSKDWFDITPLVNDTGFKCSYEFEDAIKETYRYMLENGGS